MRIFVTALWYLAHYILSNKVHDNVDKTSHFSFEVTLIISYHLYQWSISSILWSKLVNYWGMRVPKSSNKPMMDISASGLWYLAQHVLLMSTLQCWQTLWTPIDDQIPLYETPWTKTPWWGQFKLRTEIKPFMFKLADCSYLALEYNIRETVWSLCRDNHSFIIRWWPNSIGEKNFFSKISLLSLSLHSKCSARKKREKETCVAYSQCQQYRQFQFKKKKKLTLCNTFCQRKEHVYNVNSRISPWIL